jgi:hypothetical protein
MGETLPWFFLFREVRGELGKMNPYNIITCN